MLSVDLIVPFVRTAETLSFVGAARSLGLSASAVGKSVARLEATLGVRLLHRTTRRVSLTDEGALLYQRCRSILDDLEEVEDLVAAASSAPRGRLRVGLPAIGYRFLGPVLADFRDRYPEVNLDLDFDDRIVDLLEARLDVVIRSGPLPDSSLMARRLGGFRFVLCAAPAYLARAGVPQHVSDLETHALVRFRAPGSARLQPLPFRAAPPSPSGSPAALVCTNMEAVRDAALRGLGIAACPDFLVEDAIRAGDLLTVLPDALEASGVFWALWPSSRHLSPRLRAFVDFAAERLFREA